MTPQAGTTIDEAAFAALRGASRELHLAVDRDGRVVLADDRARRLLGVLPGGSLRTWVAPGCEAKLDELLARAAVEPVDGWEVPFVNEGHAITVSLAARPHPEGTVFLGHVIPDGFADAMHQVSQMMTEVVGLNRTVRQQRDEVTARNAELTRVNAELTDSNRGILSMHAELAASVEHTRQDGQLKARLVANLSHELRTPLHSILGLTQLLQSQVDGALSDEQTKQVGFIRASAEELLALVNDILDLGQIESGHTRIRIDTFELDTFISSMRGVLRPLAGDRPVELVIDDVPEGIRLDTDRGKLSQIVRNLVSNALKFTERGEVRVTSELDGDRLRLRVIDTGIGIAPEDHDLIFEEYGQIDHPLQDRVKGTGLGLPLARRLAQTLGGSLTVASERGHGATFTLDVPLHHDEAKLMDEIVERSRHKAPDAASILVVEDDRHTLFLYEKYLLMAGFHVMPARTIEEATRLLATERPAAIVLDVMLEGDASWSFLARLKSAPETRDIPVLVVTVTNREDKARALGADEFWLKPVDQDRLLRKLRDLARPSATIRVLVIDDDPTARYIIRHHLAGTSYAVDEAATGDEGVRLARERHPAVILLDFLLEGSTAFDVLDDLKADPTTRAIPVIIVTSHVLDAVDQRRLLQEAEAVISKQTLSRELAINRIRDALRKLETRRPERAR